MRGNFGSLIDIAGDDEPVEHEPARELPPLAIGQDERRMQVRAYNHWAGLIEGRNFPAIEDLEPENLPDFGPYSVLLDFTSGIEDPGISYIGDKLAAECDVDDIDLRSLADVPARSLLTRITDHYMQILANQAPIGFEAEFVNQRGATILYRGILLPYSTDDDTIDFIYGVINWKELADPQSSDELLLEVDQALEARPAAAPHVDTGTPLTDWADGPGATPAGGYVNDPAPAATDALPTPAFGAPLPEDEAGDDPLPGPSFGFDAPEVAEELFERAVFDSAAFRTPDYVPAAEPEPDSIGPSIDLAEIEPADMGLGDWLAAARETAAAARASEDRTRGALYQAIGQAYDFSLAAAEAPDELEELLADAGIKMQDRAPMTPLVKLVFGADYDKTRLTEYATALNHAHRLGLPCGALRDFLGAAEGGLKGVVALERRMRREETGKAVEHAESPRQALARKLRTLPAGDFEAIAAEGSEFALVMIRRTDTGEVEMIGEVPEDVALVERAARRLIG